MQIADKPGFCERGAYRKSIHTLILKADTGTPMERQNELTSPHAPGNLLHLHRRITQGE